MKCAALLMLLVLVGLSTPVSAGPIEEATARVERAERSVAQLAAEETAQRAALEALARRIKARKEARSRQRALVDPELNELLERSQLLAERLAELARAKDVEAARLRTEAESLLLAHDRQLAAARIEIRTVPKKLLRSKVEKLKAIVAAREQTRLRLVAAVGDDPPPALLVTTRARKSDDPDELLERADLARDQRDRVARRLDELARHIERLKEEAAVDRELRDFLSESELFDEADRVVEVRRRAAGAVASSGSGPTGEPTATRGSDPANESPEVAGAPSPDAAFDDPSPAPNASQEHPLGSGPVLLPAPSPATVLEGSLVRVPDRRELTQTPSLSGDESLEELLSQRSALESIERELESQVRALDTRAREALAAP